MEKVICTQRVAMAAKTIKIVEEAKDAAGPHRNLANIQLKWARIDFASIIKWRRKEAVSVEAAQGRQRGEVETMHDSGSGGEAADVARHSSRKLACPVCGYTKETAKMQLRLKSGFRDLTCNMCTHRSRCGWWKCTCSTRWSQCMVHRIDLAQHASTRPPKKEGSGNGHDKQAEVGFCSKRKAPMMQMREAGGAAGDGRAKRRRLQEQAKRAQEERMLHNYGTRQEGGGAKRREAASGLGVHHLSEAVCPKLAKRFKPMEAKAVLGTGMHGDADDQYRPFSRREEGLNDLEGIPHDTNMYEELGQNQSLVRGRKETSQALGPSSIGGELQQNTGSTAKLDEKNTTAGSNVAHVPDELVTDQTGGDADDMEDALELGGGETAEVGNACVPVTSVLENGTSVQNRGSRVLHGGDGIARKDLHQCETGGGIVGTKYRPLSRRETNAKCGQGLHRDVACNEIPAVVNKSSDLNLGVKLLPHLELVSGRGASCGVDQVAVDAEVSADTGNKSVFEHGTLNNDVEQCAFAIEPGVSDRADVRTTGHRSVRSQTADDDTASIVHLSSSSDMGGKGRLKDNGRPPPIEKGASGASRLQHVGQSRSSHIPGLGGGGVQLVNSRVAFGDLLKRVRQVDSAPAVVSKRIRTGSWPTMHLGSSKTVNSCNVVVAGPAVELTIIQRDVVASQGSLVGSSASALRQSEKL